MCKTVQGAAHLMRGAAGFVAPHAILALLCAMSAGGARAADWSGFYGGASLGYASGDDEAREINGSRSYRATFGGVTGAVHLGWQRQFGLVVAGIEAEGGYMNAGSTITRPVSGGSVTSGADLGAYGTLSGRLGVALGSDWLAYGRAGLVGGRLSGRTVQTCPPPGLCGGAQLTLVSSAETHDTSLGLLLGGGVERQFGGNWSGRIDYQFMDFRKELALPPVDGPGWKHSVQMHAIKIGASYRF